MNSEIFERERVGGGIGGCGGGDGPAMAGGHICILPAKNSEQMVGLGLPVE